jgi:hypothetical protein
MHSCKAFSLLRQILCLLARSGRGKGGARPAAHMNTGVPINRDILAQRTSRHRTVLEICLLNLTLDQRYSLLPDPTVRKRDLSVASGNITCILCLGY